MRKRDEVKQIVLQVLKDMTVGDEVPFDEETNVVKGLGLHTEDGLDMACLFEIRIGCELPHDVNPLFNDTRKKGSPGFERTVGDIIDLLCQLLEKEVENA